MFYLLCRDHYRLGLLYTQPQSTVQFLHCCCDQLTILRIPYKHQKIIKVQRCYQPFIQPWDLHMRRQRGSTQKRNYRAQPSSEDGGGQRPPKGDLPAPIKLAVKFEIKQITNCRM